MVAIEPESAAIVVGLAERQRRQRLLEAFHNVTHRALLGPGGGHARDLLTAWGFPPGTLDGLDLGYFPDPEFVAETLDRGGEHPREVAAALLDPRWSGHLTGPWRNPRGRILTFFAFQPRGLSAAERYAYAPRGYPSTLFGASAAPRHPVLVEGLLDALLARCLGAPEVVGLAGPFDWLTPDRLQAMAAGGVHQITLLPPDTEDGRLGVLTVLERAGRLADRAPAVLVADPDITAGARTVSELVRDRGAGGLADALSGRVDGDNYKLMMAPWGAFN